MKDKKIVRYAVSSVLSWVVDNGLFYLAKLLLGTRLGLLADSVCTVIARVFSSFFNFNLNNRFVFDNREGYGGALLRYYCLAVPQMLCSAGLLTLTDHLLGVTAPHLSTLVKIVIDTILFVISYVIQKKWVFAQKRNKTETE